MDIHEVRKMFKRDIFCIVHGHLKLRSHNRLSLSGVILGASSMKKKKGNQLRFTDIFSLFVMANVGLPLSICWSLSVPPVTVQICIPLAGPGHGQSLFDH